MRERRGNKPDHDLCSGPGKLTEALGIDLGDNEPTSAESPSCSRRPRASRRRSSPAPGSASPKRSSAPGASAPPATPTSRGRGRRSPLAVTPAAAQPAVTPAPLPRARLPGAASGVASSGAASGSGFLRASGFDAGFGFDRRFVFAFGFRRFVVVFGRFAAVSGFVFAGFLGRLARRPFGRVFGLDVLPGGDHAAPRSGPGRCRPSPGRRCRGSSSASSCRGSRPRRRR